MNHLATLTTKSEADAPLGRRVQLMAFLASVILPTGLAYTIFPHSQLLLSIYFCSLAMDVLLSFFLILLLVFFGLSLGNIWGPFHGGPRTLADSFREVSAVPEAITAFTCLTVLLTLFSCFSYTTYFLFQSNVPMWERRGPGSRMLYINAVISGLEIASAAILIKLLNSVPNSVFKSSSIGHIFYAPAYFGLIQGAITISGFILMVAGPSPLRLPDSYEPISRATINLTHPTIDSTERGSQTDREISQAAGIQSLAALYQVQRQQRQQFAIETQRKFKSRALEPDQHNLMHADGPEEAELGMESATLTTKFDGGTTYWSKYDRPFMCIHIIVWMAVLFAINGPIQIVRFIRRSRWDNQGCVSLCYLDFITPLLGAPVFIVLPIVLYCRINLERRLSRYGPSPRALIAAYYFGTIVIYITDMVLLAVQGPFDSDIFEWDNNESRTGTHHIFVPIICIYLILVSVLGAFWVGGMYSQNPTFRVGSYYNPPLQDVKPR